MATFLAGQRLTAAALNLATNRLMYRGRRVSNSTGTTSEIGVLRLDGIAAKAGRLYRIYTNNIGGDTSVANDGVRLNLRMTTDGSTAGTSSTIYTLSQTIVPNISHADYMSVDFTYTPAVDETLSVLLTVARSNGSGTVVATGGAAGAPGPIELYVEDMGVDPGDTGTDI